MFLCSAKQHRLTAQNITYMQCIIHSHASLLFLLFCSNGNICVGADLKVKLKKLLWIQCFYFNIVNVRANVCV